MFSTPLAEARTHFLYDCRICGIAQTIASKLRCDPNEIVQQSRRCDFGPGARALDDQRLLCITIAADRDPVVSPGASAKRMGGRQHAQSHACTVGTEAPDETELGAIAVSLLIAFSQRRIERKQCSIEIVFLGGDQSSRHQRIDPDFVRFQSDARRPRQDQQLAPHILAGQIDARIRFGVAGVARVAPQNRGTTPARPSRTKPENGRMPSYWSNSQASEPDSTPSTAWIESPPATSSRIERNNGNPAPTVALSP